MNDVHQPKKPENQTSEENSTKLFSLPQNFQKFKGIPNTRAYVYVRAVLTCHVE